MNNLFVIGDSFSSKTYIYELEYLLNKKFDSIYFLRETNRSDDIFIGCTCPINIVNDINEGLSICNTVLVIYSPRFTEELFTNKYGSHNLCNKQVYRINTSCIIENEGNVNSKVLYCNNIPTILIFTLTPYTQSHIVEVLLNKFFVEEGVNLFQVFSEKSSILLNQLQNDSLLNPSVYDTFRNSKHPTLVVRAIELFDNYTYADIANMNPIYTILVTEAEVSQTADDLFSIFYERFGLTLNAIVKSQFMSLKLWNTRTDLLYKGNMGVHLAHEKNPQYDSNILNSLLEDLINHISLPENIDRIEVESNI